jgi:hypothetical protein
LSRPAEETVTCPQCQNRQTFRTWDSIDAPDDPELKRDLLMGVLHAFVCGKCGHQAEIARTLLYRDRSKGLMIHWIVERDAMTQTALHARADGVPVCRLVRSRDELLEKIRIFDDGLDDRVVELAKYLLSLKLAEERHGDDFQLWYIGPAKGSRRGEGDVDFVLQSPHGHGSLPVPRAFLDEMKRKFSANAPKAETEHGRWIEVNRKYVHDWLPQLRQPKPS